MEIFDEIVELKKKYPRIYMALGMFDGMHLGHQSIVQRAIDGAKEHGGKSVVFTFLNHPLSIVDPTKMPLAIGNCSLRADVLEKMGVDILVNIPFTEDFSRISPENFLSVLKENYAPLACSVGPNYTFGYQGRGTPDLLLKLGSDYGFKADIAPAVRFGDALISSTRIRALIKEGDLPSVNSFLGRPLEFLSRVEHGEARGRTLGFPTANLKIKPNQAVLPRGAYAAFAVLNKTRYKALVNIGNNPTFGETEGRIEAHLLDFADDIYGQMLKIEFLHKLRSEKKFSCQDELIEQIKRDKAAAQAIWNKQ